MAIVLGILAALTFGVGDFLGGNSAKRLPAAQTAVYAQGFGLIPLVLAIPLLGGMFSGTDFMWGALAGAVGGVGVPLLYAALAVGPMNVVAPLTAVISAVVPVLVGTALGERPGWLGWVGIVLALGAAIAISLSTAPDADAAAAGEGKSGRPGGTVRSVRGIVLALTSGLAFGGFFSLLGLAGQHSGAWPVLAARLAGLVVAGILLLGTARFSSGPAVKRSRDGLLLGAFAGVADSIANALFLLATRAGFLTLTGALVALYPAMTVFLARMLHAERTSIPQRFGMGVAAVSVVLISVGG